MLGRCFRSESDFFGGALEKKGYRRKIRVNCYTYGFNGKERDLSFENTHYDYGFRIYNPSIGKFLSVDPLTKSYPMLTPYQFASNTPIEAIDLDGLEAMKPVYGDDGSITSVIATSDATITQTRHIPLEVKKEAPKPQLTQVFVPQTFIGPDNSNLSFSERQAKVRQYEAQVQYQNFIKTGQQLDPFTFGGSPNNPFGFASTFGTALKEAPLVVLPEVGLAKLAELRHLAKFKNGGSFLASSTQLERFSGSATFGGDALFVAPKAEIDALLSQGLSRSEIASKLGITNKNFLRGDLVRVDISADALKNLRLPTGSESGANSLFKLGGKTSGGVSEAVADPVLKEAEGVTKTIIQ